MKQVWSDAEFNAHWLLSEDELTLLKGKAKLGRYNYWLLRPRTLILMGSSLGFLS